MKSKSLLFHILTVYSFFAFAKELQAQNTPWTQQYSAYTSLTGGAGMSNSNDNSVFYYNPGAIGFIDTTSINVSANIYAYDRVSLKNGAGEGLDLISNKMNVHPQVLAGNLYFKKAPRFRFVYGYLLRNFSRFDFDQDVEKRGDFIPAANGDEFYRGKFDFSYANGEYWGGIGIGYKINEHVAIGLGHYGGFVNTKNLYYQDLTVDAVGPDSIPYVASIRQRLKYNLDHFYILFKPGIDFRFGKHKIGISSMLPSIRMFGQAKVYQSIETSNLQIYNSDSTNFLATYPNVVVVGDEKKVTTKIKQPASVSIGYEYETKTWKVACMLEYFFRVKEYELIRGTEPVFAQPEQAYQQKPIPDFMTIRTGSFGVLNFGIGFDKSLSKRFRILTGFRTDFNNKVPLFKQNYPDYITSVNPQFWNYLHYSIGLTILHKNRKTFIGLLYKYGFSNYNKNFANMSNPSNDNLFLGSGSNNMSVNIHGIGITIGYSIFSQVGEGIFKPFTEIKPKKERKKRQ